MKTTIVSHPPLRRITAHSLLLSVLLAGAAHAQTILSDDFTGATTVTPGAANTAYIDSATNWYFFNPNVNGLPGTLATAGSPSPIAGNAIQFSGGSSNSLTVGGFSAVTLDNPGETLTLTLNYRYSTAPTSGMAILGLFNDNGTAVTANGFNNRAEIVGDKGYEVRKLATSGASDLTVNGGTEGAATGNFSYFGVGAAALTTTTTGYVPSSSTSAVYTETLTLTLASNGTSLLIDSSFGVVGGSTFSTTQQTIASPLTLTFNEIVFSPTTGGGGVTLMDNVLLTNVIPEPSTTAMFGLGLLGLVALQRCRTRGRRA